MSRALVDSKEEETQKLREEMEAANAKVKVKIMWITFSQHMKQVKLFDLKLQIIHRSNDKVGFGKKVKINNFLGVGS